ncbi:unnamed protein product [Dicrocoelium dendriticum]|nr:unnamed protein product [Dicrocoelium dendriticum]
MRSSQTDHVNPDNVDGPSLTPRTPCHFIAQPALSGNTGLERTTPFTQATTIPTSFQIAVQLLNSIADFEHDESSQTNTADTISGRPSGTSAGLQSLTRRLISLASSVSVANTTHTNSSCTNSDAHLGQANRAARDRPPPSASKSELATESLTSPLDGTVHSSTLTPISIPWSATASPTAVATFQNALAQMAVLGLSSQTFDNGIDIVRTTTASPTDHSGCNPSSTLKRDTVHTEPGTDSFTEEALSQHATQESGSKVIIRQTADADEHFFKALRGLKVDVSSDTRPMTTRLPTTASPLDSKSRLENARAAAELAVEEHFEKSLAAFPGFTNHRGIFCNEKTSILELPSACSSVKAHAKSSKSVGYSNGSSTFKQNSQTGVAARKQQLWQSSPLHTDCTGANSPSSEIPKPPPYSRQNALHYIQSYMSSGLDHPPITSSIFSGTIKDAEEMSQLVEASYKQEMSEKDSLSNAPTMTSGTAAHNSFKPKKNWMAQYGEKASNCDETLVEPVGVDAFGRDLSFTLPISSVSPSMPIVERELGVSYLGIHPDQHDSNEASQFRARHRYHAKEMKKLTNTESHNYTTSRENSVMNATESTAQHGSLCLEKAKITNAQDHRGAFDWYHLSKHQVNDKLPRPQQPVDLQTQRIQRQDIKSSARFLTDWTAPAINDERSVHEVDTNLDGHTEAHGAVPIGRSTCDVLSSRLGDDTKSLTNWGLSNSSSPSPAPEESPSNSAITPVSGANSGFFSGSTYSLDSALSHTQSSAFEARESDSGIDAKSISSATDDHIFCHSKSHTLTESSMNLNGIEQTGYLCGLRKRASSEIIPWSTMKRSRSVLTSPVSCSDPFRSCSPGANDLIHSMDCDFIPANKRFALLSEYTSRSMGGKSRPLTPDMTILQPIKSESTSSKTSDCSPQGSTQLEDGDSCLPRSCTLYPQSYESKSKIQPNTLSKKPSVPMTGRSV